MGFKFREKTNIEIGGKKYECDIGNLDLVESVLYEWPKITRELQLAQKFEAEFTAFCKSLGIKDPALVALDDIETITATEDDLAEMTRRKEEAHERLLGCIESCKGFIFGAIGEEEYKEIFAGRRVKLQDHVELCSYIYNWVSSERSKVAAQIAGVGKDPAPNRGAQRKKR